MEQQGFDDDNDRYIGKAILLGESGVGKTSLINITGGGKFNENEVSSISSNFIKKYFDIDSKKYLINIWDTAGQEKYKHLAKLFFHGSDIVILVYDISSKESFKGLEYWYKETKEHINNKTIYGIVGNKKDLYLKEEVTEGEGRKYAESKGAKFALVSAKDDPKSFTDFFLSLVKDCRVDIENKIDNISLKNQKDKKKKDCKC
jgi:small GTP-binding protein